MESWRADPKAGSIQHLNWIHSGILFFISFVSCAWERFHLTKYIHFNYRLDSFKVRMVCHKNGTHCKLGIRHVIGLIALENCWIEVKDI